MKKYTVRRIEECMNISEWMKEKRYRKKRQKHNIAEIYKETVK